MIDDEPGSPASGEDRRENNLQSALSGLADLSIGGHPLPSMLTRVAELAVRAIPNADGVGVTLQHGSATDVIVASTQLVSDVDEVQYRVGEGPCITAAATGKTVRSGSLDTEQRWPQFSPSVGKFGVRSVLSLPLIVGRDTVIGAMNVYSRTGDAFDDGAVRIGESFAVPAAVSVQNARALADAVALSEKLREALHSRSTVDRAIGITMSRNNCGSAEALDTLRDVGRRDNRTVEEVAITFVDGATGPSRFKSTDT